MNHGFQSLYELTGRPRWFWPAILTLLAVIVVSASFVSPAISEIETEQAIYEDLRSVPKSVQARQRWVAAVQDLCGGENATWEELPNGAVQCGTKRGFKTITIK